MGNLRDRVAVITGASSGLGEAMAQRFASTGARVVVNYRANEAGATAAVAAIRANGGEAIAHQADVTRSEDADGLIARAVQEFGRLDILVNNAGMRQDALVLRMRDRDWQDVLTTNLTAAFLCTRPALRTMVRQRYGRILNVASVVGIVGNPGQANYAAAKAGLIGLTRATAREGRDARDYGQRPGAGVLSYPDDRRCHGRVAGVRDGSNPDGPLGRPHRTLPPPPPFWSATRPPTLRARCST